METSNFKQKFLDILLIKSKKVTLLLGTFVPFFFCHVFALAVSIDKFKENSSSGAIRYIKAFILPSFLFLFAIYFPDFLFLRYPSNVQPVLGSYSYVLVPLTSILGTLIIQFLGTLLFYKIFLKKRGDFPKFMSN
jgi:hypothetical protein